MYIGFPLYMNFFCSPLTLSVSHLFQLSLNVTLDADLSRNTGGSDSIPYKRSDAEMNVCSKDKSRYQLRCQSNSNILRSSGLKARQKNPEEQGSNNTSVYLPKQPERKKDQGKTKSCTSDKPQERDWVLVISLLSTTTRTSNHISLKEGSITKRTRKRI